MIGISKLYCGTIEPSDVLRYKRRSSELPSHLLQFSLDKKPVVVWNCTKACNLNCVHCYSQSNARQAPDELTTEQGKELLTDLAEFGAPVVLFSGGEPLMRKDLFELAPFAREKGMRVVISTNGTLIDKQAAEKLKKIDVSYVGVSFDAIMETNDNFRRTKGAFERALQGIRNCQDAGIKVGLRFTITKHNNDDIPAIFDLIKDENIPRVCFYHLVYSGRGSEIQAEDLSHDETRKTVDLIIDKTAEFHKAGKKIEVLTVDNHADGVYLYMRMKRENHPRAEEVMELLKMNGGNSTGIGIGCVSWNGDIHPDQFWRYYSFGNVKERKFSDVWVDLSDPIMKVLKDRKPHIKGRCSKCKWLDICNANFRVRAEAVTDDIWESDPACYLTDEEIGLI